MVLIYLTHMKETAKKSPKMNGYFSGDIMFDLVCQSLTNHLQKQLLLKTLNYLTQVQSVCRVSASALNYSDKCVAFYYFS